MLTMRFITKFSLFENMKLAKQLAANGKISEETVQQLNAIDPSKTKKYVGWLAKIYSVEPFDINSVKSYIEEYDVFINKGKADNKDINVFKTLEAFKQYVDELNNTTTASLKELETDYDVIMDTDDLYIASPNTHEASRKLGLTTFAHRDDGKDSAWCTTYKNSSHFNSYFYNNNVTFYYIKVLSEDMKLQLDKVRGHKAYELYILAVAVMSDGQLEAYDANDTLISSSDLDRIRKIIGI